MRLLIFLLLGVAMQLHGQQVPLDSNVKLLKEEIRYSSKEKKIKLLDSLCNLVLYEQKYNYDSIVTQTIDYAIEIDSFRLAVKHTSDRIFYLSNRARNPEEAKRIFEELKSKHYDISDPLTNAVLNMNAGDSYFFSGEVEKSIDIYSESEKYAVLAKDSTILSKAKVYGAEALTRIGKFAEAGLLLTEAEEISAKAKDTSSLMIAQNYRANLYGSIGFVEDANAVRDDLIKIAKHRKHYYLLQSTFYNKAVDNEALEDYESMVYNLKQANHYVDKANRPNEKPKVLIALFRVYAKTDSLKKAKTILEEIHNLPDYLSIADDNFNYNAALAHYEFSRGNTRKAIYIQEGLIDFNSSINITNRQSVHNFLANAYEKINNTDKAYYHFKKFASLTDSINNLENTRALTYYQTLYETKKRDAMIESQEAEIGMLDIKNKAKDQLMLFGGTGLALAFVIIYLVRTQKFTRKQKKNQVKFSQELIKTQETERTKVARDLHDSVGQKLMLLIKKIKAFKDDDIDYLAKDTMEELRSISKGLYPATIERLGVTAVIESLINQVDANTNIFFTTDIDNIDNDLSKENALHLYRCIQEALNNIVKHSKAKTVAVNISKDDANIEAVIQDNGIGFEINERLTMLTSMGMKTLLERARIMRSRLFVDSKPNKGTTMRLMIPIT
ncbi:ATP-binding protein [Winogradskyella sp. 3972H.M.0a.05]|uniref:tetratricopeptide repeat-containing sensor histidine kinase n=1 Tax=Winogradskyella sp. 3972H.M.0a.05 TaxID=2950277 RepID=UPI0033978F3F